MALATALLLAGLNLPLAGHSRAPLSQDHVRPVIPGFPPPILEAEPVAPDDPELEEPAPSLDDHTAPVWNRHESVPSEANIAPPYQPAVPRSVIGGTPKRPRVILPDLPAAQQPDHEELAWPQPDDRQPPHLAHPAQETRPAPDAPMPALSPTATPSAQPAHTPVVAQPQPAFTPASTAPSSSPQTTQLRRPQAPTPARPPASELPRHANGTVLPYYPKKYQHYIAPTHPETLRLHQQALQHYNRANYYGSQNQLDQAIAEYHQALLLEPYFSDAYVGLATALMHRNQWEEVLTHAQHALKLNRGFRDPLNLVQAHYNLAVAHCAVDDYRRAKRYYDYVQQANHPAKEQLWLFLQRSCKR